MSEEKCDENYTEVNQEYFKMCGILDDPKISHEDKLKAGQEYFRKMGIEIPQNVCMCVTKDGDDFVFVHTSDTDPDDWADFKNGTSMGPCLGPGRVMCSGTYIKGE